MSNLQLVTTLTSSEEPVSYAIAAEIWQGNRLQPSPAQKSRCHARGACRSIKQNHRYNPHQLRRAGVIEYSAPLVIPPPVTTLTSSEEPVSSGICSPDMYANNCYNPHQLRRAGVIPASPRTAARRSVTTLTSSEEPVSCWVLVVGHFCFLGYNPHQLRRAGVIPDLFEVRTETGVTTLTSSEEPVSYTISGSCV